jgi:hypothetical protein
MVFFDAPFARIDAGALDRTLLTLGVENGVGAHLSAATSAVIAFARVAEDGPGVATSIRAPIALPSPAARPFAQTECQFERSRAMP